MLTLASQDLDANSRTVNSHEAFRVEKTVTFAALTTGAIGTFTIFNTTGVCNFNLYSVVETALDSDGAATLSLGFDPGGVDDIKTATGYASLGLNKVISPAANVGVGYYMEDSQGSFVSRLNFTYSVADAALKAGKIHFIVTWRPLTTDALIAAA